MTGKVRLVGAGPGDAGLLTLRGREVLLRADVVVCDALVGDGVRAMIPESARVIDAGKRAGHHHMKQEDISRLLLAEALKGHNVVRLKGGDPFLFGRGGEELELLREHGVPFEVVPGVTSALAAPAYFGIPVTHRDHSAGVHIVTAHRRADGEVSVDYASLARLEGTLIFLMGVSAAGDIARGLMSEGMSKDTPVAVLSRATTARQVRISATLETLPDVHAEAPAVIAVGRVCDPALAFPWYDARPLAGVRVMVTRPRELMSRLSAMLREAGAEVLEHPAIRTVPAKDTREVDDAIARLVAGGFDRVAFTSPSGVRIFIERLIEVADLRALGGVKLAAIGEGTRRALLERGLKADLMPETYDGASLGIALREDCRPGERILIPRAALGDRELTDELARGKGLEVCDVATYDTEYLPMPADVEADLYAFTSASTVRAFAASRQGRDMTGLHAVCIGRQTAEAASACGMMTRVAERATLESLVEATVRAAEALPHIISNTQ